MVKADILIVGLSSHLKTLPKPESLRHLKILPETPAPRAAVFPLASPLAGLVIVAPEPTVRAGFLPVGCAEAWEGRRARRLNVQPCQGERRGRVGTARGSRPDWPAR